ncbi:MAG TPA: hypothetical protein HPP97_02695 [Desulfuromonadales bacterium]|nr:hypothetical protein [Desulfuromonadales bacterium]
MKANRVPSEAKREFGKMIPDYDNIPFEAENDYEEMLLHYLSTISNAVGDIEAELSGELENAVVMQLCQLELSLSAKLQTIINELRQQRSGGCTCHG